MSDAVSSPTTLPATDADGKLLLAPDEARALLRECCAQFQTGLVDVLTASSRSELVIAIVEAAVVKLPIAVFCLLLARSVERRLAAAELAAEDCA